MRAEDSPLTGACGSTAEDLAYAAVAFAALGTRRPSDVVDTLALWCSESPAVLDDALKVAKVASDHWLGLPQPPNSNVERAVVILAAARRRLG